MQRHVNADVVEQYVIGALDLESSRFVEGHVASCAECAELLQREAAIEVGLHDVAAMKKVVLFSTRRRRVGALIASAAVIAAAAVVLIVSNVPLIGLNRSIQPSLEARPVLRKCTDERSAADCISRAQFDGLITIGPDQEPIVPRYDVVSPEGAAP